MPDKNNDTKLTGDRVQAMGQHGAEGILAELKNRGKDTSRGISLLTHCNTGSLATAGFGTALGVVRTLHAQGVVKHVYCTETRPYNQGVLRPLHHVHKPDRSFMNVMPNTTSLVPKSSI